MSDDSISCKIRDRLYVKLRVAKAMLRAKGRKFQRSRFR